jgi:hypothetical protein
MEGKAAAIMSQLTRTSGYNPEVVDTDERESVAAELRRLREGASPEGQRAARLPPPATNPPRTAAASPEPAPEPVPPRPDATAVNSNWDVARTPTSSLLEGVLRRLVAPLVRAQVAWNAGQVQLDNEILGYVDARIDATHRHYDRVLGVHGRHIEDINERHRLLQEDLVGHVHDLVKRIDLVLGEAEQGRLGLEAALRDVRARLAGLEERIGRG